MHQPGQPRPFAPQPTAIRGQITATTGESASVPATVLSSSRILPLAVLPLTPGNPELYRFRLHTFRTRARAGLMLPVRRTPPGQYTGIPQAHPKTNRRPWFRSHLNIFRRVNGRGLTSIAHLPGPHLTRSQPRLFPRRSARQSLANAPRGGLKPPPRKAAPEDQTPSISSHSTTGQQALHQPLRLPPALVFTTGFDAIVPPIDASAVVHARSSSRRTPDPLTAGLFPQRSPPRLLTGAACGGLGSPPARRTRRTYLHHWHSTVRAGDLLHRLTPLSGHTAYRRIFLTVANSDDYRVLYSKRCAIK